MVSKILSGLLLGVLTLTTFQLALSMHRMESSLSLLQQELERARQATALAKRDPSDSNSAPGLSSSALRQLIADAVQDQLADREPSVAQADAPSPAQRRREDQLAREVGESIQYHISVGTISQADMQTLQQQILRLDQEARRRALGELVTAINDGTIKARL